MNNIAKTKPVLVSNISKSISFNRYEFDIEFDVWVLNKNKELNVDFIDEFDSSFLLQRNCLC